jgi:hypothetical protein
LERERLFQEKPIIRREIATKFVLVAFFSAVAPATALAQRPWKFIVTCDSRGQNNGIQTTILTELVQEITSQQVDFVLFPGDLVSGYSAAGPSGFEAQLRAWVQIMKPVYDAGIRVYVCRGNHEIIDVWGIRPRPDIDPDDNYATRWLNVFASELYPEQKLPDNGPLDEKYMTYAVTHENALVVLLDEYAGIRHETVNRVNQKWLDAQLAANTKPHIFVAGHETAFRAFHTDGLDNWPAERDVLWASLENTGARTFFCGHDHFYDHARVDDGDNDPNDDIHQYIIATAGARPYAWSPPYSGNNGHYAVEQWHHAEQYGYVLVEIDGLSAKLTWIERDMDNLNVTGSYGPREAWSYTVTPKPIVLSPNGGESFVAAGTCPITWKTLEGAAVDYVTIEFSSDGGQSWQQVSQSPNTGRYQWDPVPLVNSDQCLIRICDSRDPGISDTSDRTFAIFQCQKNLTADLNGDCYVDLLDLAILTGDWLKCGNPFDAACN